VEEGRQEKRNVGGASSQRGISLRIEKSKNEKVSEERFKIMNLTGRTESAAAPNAAGNE